MESSLIVVFGTIVGVVIGSFFSMLGTYLLNLWTRQREIEKKREEDIDKLFEIILGGIEEYLIKRMALLNVLKNPLVTTKWILSETINEQWIIAALQSKAITNAKLLGNHSIVTGVSKLEETMMKLLTKYKSDGSIEPEWENLIRSINLEVSKELLNIRMDIVSAYSEIPRIGNAVERKGNIFKRISLFFKG